MKFRISRVLCRNRVAETWLERDVCIDCHVDTDCADRQFMYRTFPSHTHLVDPSPMYAYAQRGCLFGGLESGFKEASGCVCTSVTSQLPDTGFFSRSGSRMGVKLRLVRRVVRNTCLS